MELDGEGLVCATCYEIIPKSQYTSHREDRGCHNLHRRDLQRPSRASSAETPAAGGSKGKSKGTNMTPKWRQATNLNDKHTESESNHENHSHTNTGQHKAPTSAGSMPPIGGTTKSASVVDTDATKHLRQEVTQTTPTSRPETKDQESPNGTTPVACLWKKFSEAINTLRTTATHKLTATGSSLSEWAGVGNLHQITFTNRNEPRRHIHK